MAPVSTPATAIRRPCQSPWIRRPEVHDAVVSISTTKAATVHGTARIPRSSRAITLSWTAARTTTTIGNQPSPTRAQRPRATVRPVIASRPAPNPAYDAIPCTAPSSPTRPTPEPGEREPACRGRPGGRGLLVLAGCGGGDRAGPSPGLARVVAARRPTGTRAVVRDATYCGGRWYVVGATATPSAQTRPAVWSSTDAHALARRRASTRAATTTPRARSSARWAAAAAGSRCSARSRAVRTGCRARRPGGSVPTGRWWRSRVVRAVRRRQGRARQPPGRRPARLAHRRDPHQRRRGLAVDGRAAPSGSRRGHRGWPARRGRPPRAFDAAWYDGSVVGGRDLGRPRRLRVGDLLDAGRRRPVVGAPAARRTRRSPPPSGSPRRRRGSSRSGSTTTRSGPGRSPAAPGRRPRRSASATRTAPRRRTSSAWRRWGTRSRSPTATARTSGSRSDPAARPWPDVAATGVDPGDGRPTSSRWPVATAASSCSPTTARGGRVWVGDAPSGREVRPAGTRRSVARRAGLGDAGQDRVDVDQVRLLDVGEVPAGLGRAAYQQAAAGHQEVAGAAEHQGRRQARQVAEPGADLRATEVVGAAGPPRGVRMDLADEEPRVDRVERRRARASRWSGRPRARSGAAVAAEDRRGRAATPRRRVPARRPTSRRR